MDRANSDEPADVQAMIDELAAHSAELGALLQDTVTALAALASKRPPATEDDGDAPEVDRRLLAPDILEIARLQAQAAGVGVEEYLREAVLAYAAGAHDGDGATARARRAREDARRLRADIQALRAQAAQTSARAARIEEHAQAARRRANADGRPSS